VRPHKVSYNNEKAEMSRPQGQIGIEARRAVIQNDGTARSVIRLMGGCRVGIVAAGAVPSSVPSCLQRTKTSTL